MIDPTDNETWLIESSDAVIQKKARLGMGGLSQWEALVYCVWVADYGMRNAGDLDAAKDLYSGFHADALRIAGQLSLSATYATFSLTRKKLEQQYFARFDAMVDEVRRSQSTFIAAEP